MTILSFVSETPGFAGTLPRIAQMVCTDNFATITAPGFLNNVPICQGQPKSNGDFVMVRYGVTAVGGGVISGGTPVILTMSIPANSSTITLQVPTSDIPAFVQGVTPGTSAASKALSLDGSSEIDGVNWTSIVGAGTYYYGEEPASAVTVSTTPASGSCAAQFQLKNSVGDSLAQTSPFFMYVSDGSNNLTTAVTSLVALTHGALVQLVTGRVAFGTTDSSGRIGITLTASAGTYAVTFVMPNGSLYSQGGIVVNA